MITPNTIKIPTVKIVSYGNGNWFSRHEDVKLIILSWELISKEYWLSEKRESSQQRGLIIREEIENKDRLWDRGKKEKGKQRMEEQGIKDDSCSLVRGVF